MNAHDELLADYLDTLSAVKDMSSFGLVFASPEDKDGIATWFEGHGYVVADRYTDEADSVYLSGAALETAARETPRAVRHSHIFILTDEEYRNASQTDMFGPVCDMVSANV